MIGALVNTQIERPQSKTFEVQLLRHMGDRWVASLPLLNARITGSELILQPGVYNPPPAARIPASYIQRISRQDIDMYPAVCLELKDRSCFYLMINWDEENQFIEALYAAQKAPRGIRWMSRLSTYHLRRVIEQVMSL